MDDLELAPVLLGEHGHRLAAGEVADAGHGGRAVRLLAKPEQRAVAELVGPVHRVAPRPASAPVRTVALDRDGHHRRVGRLVEVMDVDVVDGAAPAVVPDHRRLGEVEELPEVAAQSGSCEAARHPQRPQPAARAGEQRAQVGREQRAPAWRQHRVRARCLVAVGLREQIVRLGPVDADRLDLDPESTQRLDLAQDEGGGDRRVAADDIGDAHRRPAYATGHPGFPPIAPLPCTLARAWMH